MRMLPQGSEAGVELFIKKRHMGLKANLLKIRQDKKA
jgi:hypothetical protein